MLISLNGFKAALFLDPLSQTWYRLMLVLLKEIGMSFIKKSCLNGVQTSFAGGCLLETPLHSVTSSSCFPYATSGPSSFTYRLHYYA